MQSINMNELNYDVIDDIYIKLLPCEIELLVRGMETYMFIFHNIYSQHEDTDEQWTRDFIAMNLYNKLMSKKNTNSRTNYDVIKNCENHANRSKQKVWYSHKKYLKNIA